MTRTENDVRKFNEALDKCRRPVWLVSSDGRQYNMKSTEDYSAGMAKWIMDTNNEMEIYAAGREEEAVMMGFYLQMCA